MRLRPLTAVVLCACALATGAAAAQGDPGDPAHPAPPPAGYCRLAPDGAWPALGTDGPVADLAPFQDYRVGLGIDGTERGEGVTIADVEYEWRATHVELAPLRLPVATPVDLPPWYRSIEHGTAVLGLLGGADDGQGITGLAPASRLLPLSPYIGGAYLPADAVRSAADGLEPGDVLLVELQGLVTTVEGEQLLVPIETFEKVRNAIREAVDAGIVVVEPAGNGALDVGGLAAAPWLAGPDAPGHSGALMVGGGGAGLDESQTPDLQRVAGSNHGARVDVQGYGAGVVTSGYGDQPWSPEGGDRSFTACFDGTSSAAATVAGAVAVLQGAEIARDGTPLTPAEVRTVLVATGRPQAEPGSETIGPRPHVGRAIDALPGLDSPPPPPPDASPPVLTEPPPVVLQPLGQPVPVSVGATAAPSEVVPPCPRPAVRALSARVDRSGARVRLRLRGLAPRAVVRVDGRRVPVVRGGVVLRGAAPRRLVVTVAAPPRPGAVFRPARFRVTIPGRGAARVVRTAPRAAR